MKKTLLAFICIFFTKSFLFSQTYEQFATPVSVGLGDYGFYQNYGDTVKFQLTGFPAGAYTDAIATIYFMGDNGDGGEEVDFSFDGTYIGTKGTNPGSDCAPEDSFSVTIPLVTLTTFLANDTINIWVNPLSNVDFFCTTTIGTETNITRIKLSFDYCPGGIPQFANISVADSIFCPYDASISLAGTPSGGVFSGPGVSGSTFNPAGLATGNYFLTYTASDLGCETEDEIVVRILPTPTVNDILVCPNATGDFDLNAGNTYVWSDNSMFSPTLDTVSGTFTTPTLANTAGFFVATATTDINIFMIDTLVSNDSIVVDHDAITGDDRSGIAVTPTHVYYVGDDNSVRYDIGLTNPSAPLPIRDGIFSNLQNGNLYTLWNGVSDPSNPSTYTVTSIRGMDINLDFTPEIITLSTSINLDNGSSDIGIFAGSGILILGNGNGSGEFYVVNLNNGNVTTITAPAEITDYMGSENWADWGVAEFDGTDYSVVYMSSNGVDVNRYNLTTGNITVAASFPNDLNDLACFTISPWNGRWYGHHENASGTFGGNSETLFEADANFTFVAGNVIGIGCYSEVSAIVNTIDLGNDTTICAGQIPYIIDAGFGWESYTWNGNNNNWNIFPVTTTDTYILEVEDSGACIITDAINVTVDACIGIEDEAGMIAKIYPNPNMGSFLVDINAPINGTLNYEVLDMHGRVVLQQKINVQVGFNQVPVQVNVEDGIYMVKINLDRYNKSYLISVKN